MTCPEEFEVPPSLEELVAEQPDMAATACILYEILQYTTESNPAFSICHKDAVLYLIDKYLPDHLNP